MTPEQYRAGIAALGLTQVGAAAVWGVSPRTAQTYATSGPPRSVALALVLLLRLPESKRRAFLEGDIDA